MIPSAEAVKVPSRSNKIARYILFCSSPENVVPGNYSIAGPTPQEKLQVGTYPYYLKQRILGDKGHLSNELSGRLLSEVLHDGFKMAILGHLSKENNYERLAYETVRLEIDMADSPYRAGDFPICVAKREEVSELIEF